MALQQSRVQPWWLGVDDDDVVDDVDDAAPTLEFVVHHADWAEDDAMAPAIFAFELTRRDAAQAALMELAASDSLFDDDPQTREFVVPSFSDADFDAAQIDALLAMDVDSRFADCGGGLDLELEEVEIEIDESPPATATVAAQAWPAARVASPTLPDQEALMTTSATPAGWPGNTWLAVGALVFAAAVFIAAGLIAITLLLS